MGGSNFNVRYGRIESTVQTGTYHYSQWKSKYNEKIKKGYVDVTHIVADKVEAKEPEIKINYSDIKEKTVAEFISTMEKYTAGLVNKVYSVKSSSVTQKQVDEAQTILDNLAELAKVKKKDVTLINTELIKLYMIIPRYIKDVRKEILPHIDLEKTLAQEQDNLDAMASQVSMNTKSKKAKVDKKTISILDKLGVSIKQIKSSPEVDRYVRQITRGYSVKAIFEVNKDSENNTFENWLKSQNNKKTGIVIHGTKCTSVLPIFEQGLKIRPAGNFHFSGKAYGNGNYFSEDFQISSGYMGWDNDKVLLVYEVHIGKASKTSYNDYNEIKSKGYDSFEMQGRDKCPMRVIYKEEQSRIKYAIWLK